MNCHKNSITSVLNGDFITVDYPKVLVHLPKSGELGVGPETIIQLVFNKKMKAESVKFAFYLTDSVWGTKVDVILEKPTSTGFLFKPSTKLDFSTSYHVQLSTTASDTFGNFTQTPLNYQFTTYAVDTIAPDPINNIYMTRFEHDRATITWDIPDLNATQNQDLAGYVIVRTEGMAFAGAPQQQAYLSSEILGNGVVVQVFNKDATSYTDNDIVTGRNYQYTIFSRDNFYNYGSPVSTPVIINFISTTGTDPYHSINLSWTLDRNCKVRTAHSFNDKTPFGSSDIRPLTPLPEAFSGSYLLASLTSGRLLHFGFEAIDNFGNSITLGTILTPLSPVAYSSDPTLVQYITDGDATSTRPDYSSDFSKIVFQTDADNFSGSHLNNGVKQIAEWDRVSGIVTYLTDGDDNSTTAYYNFDASKVVFITHADTFVGGSNGTHSQTTVTQIVEWDRGSGQVTYLTDGSKFSNSPRYHPSGDKVIFKTAYNGFPGGPVPNVQQIAEWDRTTGINYITNGDAVDRNPRYSLDGSKIAFETKSTIYVGTHTFGTKWQLTEWDRGTGIISYITDGSDHSYKPKYLSNDNKIAFETLAENFIGTVTYPGYKKIAEWDRSSGDVNYLSDGDNLCERINVNSTGVNLYFQTQADNFAGVHVNSGSLQIVQYDRNTGITAYLIDGDAKSQWIVVHPDGDHIVFSTLANNFSGPHINVGIEQIAEWVRP